MRSLTWWLRRIVAFVVAGQAAGLPGLYTFIAVAMLTDPAHEWWAIVPGVAVYGFVFAVVFTLIVDGPRQLLALTHRHRVPQLGATVGPR